jgi:hypothetical protein
MPLSGGGQREPRNASSRIGQDGTVDSSGGERLETAPDDENMAGRGAGVVGARTGTGSLGGGDGFRQDVFDVLRGSLSQACHLWIKF